MSDAGYVVAGYAVTAVTVVAYVARLFQRARAVARMLPEEKRWP